MRFQIRHLSGSRAGQEEIIDAKVVTVGRDPSSLLRFDPHQDDRVSTHHAQILVQDNGQVLLTDLGSSNGTFIGEQRLSGAIPLMNGAMVSFGDGGPQVSITFLPPAPPPPAAEPPKKSNKKLIIIVVVAAVLALACGVGGLVLLLSGDEETTAPADGDQPAKPPAEQPPAEQPPAEQPPAEQPPAEQPAGDTKGWESPWAKLGEGTVFEFKTTTDMDIGGTKMSTASTMRQTLKAKGQDEATIEMETIMDNVPPTKSEMQVPLRGEAAEGEQPKYLEEKQTEVEVPAGKFSCTYRKLEQDAGGQKSTTEMWMDDALPVPYKTVTTTPTMTSTMELVSMDKK